VASASSDASLYDQQCSTSFPRAARHVLLQVQILLAKPDNPGQSAFECQELALENSVSSMANLRLGMAVTMMHVIRWACWSYSAC
jgi:hypothetical protein